MQEPYLHGSRYVVHVEIELRSARAGCSQVIGNTESTTDGKGPSRDREREKLMLRDTPCGRSESPVENVTVEGRTWKPYSVPSTFDSWVQVGLYLERRPWRELRALREYQRAEQTFWNWELVFRSGYVKCSYHVSEAYGLGKKKEEEKRKRIYDLAYL